MKKLCIALLIGICLMCIADIALSYGEYRHYQKTRQVTQPEQRYRPDNDLRRRIART